MISPVYVVDVGWLLSFAALLGVMVLSPIMRAYFYGKKKAGGVAQMVMVSLAAQIMTLPIVVFFFGEVSVVGVVTNLLVLWTVPYVMLLVFLSGVCALVLLPLGELVGFLTTWLLRYQVFVMEWFGRLSWATVEMELGIAGVIGIYIAILGGAWYMKRVSGCKPDEFPLSNHLSNP
jgi:competence protein ComEC